MASKTKVDFKWWQIVLGILFGIMSLPAALVALLVYWLLQLWGIDGSTIAIFIWITGTLFFWIWISKII